MTQSAEPTEVATFKLPLDVKRAIELEAAERGIDPRDVVTKAVRHFYPRACQRARRIVDREKGRK